MTFSWDELSKKRYLPVLITATMLLLNWWAGHIHMPTAMTTDAQFRDIGGALALPIIGGFCWFFLPILDAKAQSSVLNTARLSGSSIKLAELYAKFINRVPATSFKPALLIGLLTTLTYLYVEDLFYVPEMGLAMNIKRILLIIETVYFWSGVYILILSLVRVTMLVTRFTARHLRIELFHIEELIPLAQTVFWNTIFCSVGLALSPIFWLGRNVPLIDIFIVTGFLVFILFLLFFPVFKVRQIVSHKKKLALARIREALKEATQSEGEQQRRLTDSPERLVKINNLVGVREEISRTREWPINLPVFLRFFLIVMVPPITWAGASIVDWVVKQFIS